MTKEEMTNEISVEEAIEVFKFMKRDVLEESKEDKVLDMAIKALEQEPKTGHWEWVQYDSNPNIGNWHCSECRTIIPHMPIETDRTPIYKWCPMCGAKMAESEECEDKRACENCKHYVTRDSGGLSFVGVIHGNVSLNRRKVMQNDN